MWFLSTSETIEQTKTPSRLLHLLRKLVHLTLACLSRSRLIRISCCLSLSRSLQVLRERSCGYGILVSQVPKDTEAFYSLRDPSEVNLLWSFFSFSTCFYPVGFVRSSLVNLCVCLSVTQVMGFLNSLVRWKKHPLWRNWKHDDWFRSRKATVLRAAAIL